MSDNKVDKETKDPEQEPDRSEDMSASAIRKKENEEEAKVLYNFHYKGVNYMGQFLGTDKAGEQEIDERFPDTTNTEKEEILKILKMHMIVYPAEATHM